MTKQESSHALFTLIMFFIGICFGFGLGFMVSGVL